MAAVRQDDIETLYTAHAGQLRRIVGGVVRARDAEIDDACQVAWSRLIRRPGTVRRDAALTWLTTTACREALKAKRRARRELSLDALIDQGAALPEAAPTDQVVELRHRLAEIGNLPRRQQRLLWLQGAGFSYNEMAGRTGASRRTVERQLLRAKSTLKARPELH